MVRVSEKTAYIDAKMPASEIKDVRETLMKHAENLDAIVLEGGIDVLETSILFQLLLSMQKSHPAIAITLFDGKEVKTLKWGRWELK